MRVLPAIALICLLSLTTLAQDGGNMGYFKPADVDKSFEGYSIHLDFGKSSKWAKRFKLEPEEFEFDVRGKKVRFREHRVDDGYNNWFVQQYLVSIAPVDGKTLKLNHFVLLEVKQKEFRVRAVFFFTDKDGKEIADGGFSAEYDFEKSDIAEVLVESKALRNLRTKKRPQ